MTLFLLSLELVEILKGFPIVTNRNSAVNSQFSIIQIFLIISHRMILVGLSLLEVLER